MTAQREHNQYVRFVLSQRVEHLLMVASFVVLALTGLPQKYPDSAWADTLFRLLGGIELTRLIHHYAAAVLILDSIYHIAAVGYRIFVRRVRLSMLPTLVDVRDGLQALLYNYGLAEQKPQMGRYSFGEKVEYWSLVWGTLVMILTGLLMWNPIAATRFLPGQFIPAAKVAHGSEALLAVLAVIVWHIYSVHVVRFNKAMFTGKIDEHEMIAEHALELADIKAGVASRPLDARLMSRRRALYLPVAGVTFAVLAVGVYYFLTFEQTAIATMPAQPNIVVYLPQTPTPFPPTPTAVVVPTAAGAKLTWNDTVGPMLSGKCTACHGTIKGLSLATYADAIKGAQDGPVIIPDNVAGSKLVVIQSAGNHPGQLSADELATIKDWIAQGAPEK